MPAREVAVRGWKIFPLVGKVPHRGTHGLTEASSELSQIEKWERAYPNTNTGIATGPSSLVVLDIDPRNGGHLSLALLEVEHERIPKTVECSTGGEPAGRHLYFNAPTGTEIRSRAGTPSRGIDVKARGGYVVAPGSIHPNTGRSYEWAPGCSPTQVKLAELPVWLFDLLRDSPRPKRVQWVAEAHHPDLDDKVARARAYLQKIPGAVSGQHGHKQTFKTALKVGPGFDLPPEVALRLLREWNTCCEPPWSEKELRHKVEDADSKYDGARGWLVRAQSPHPSQNISQAGAQRRSRADETRPGDAPSMDNRDIDVAGSDRVDAGSPTVEYGTHPELGRATLGRLRNGSPVPVIFDLGALYRYSEKVGLFELIAPAAGEVAVHTFDKCSVQKPAGGSTTLVLKQSDIRGAIACAYAQANQSGFFAGARPGLAFRDVFVSVTSKGVEVFEHSPAHRATVGVPFDFPRRSEAPQFVGFLLSLFRDDEDGAAKADLIMEFAGACLIGVAPRYQKALVLLGAGSNGKSTLVRILWELFPEHARSAIPIQAFSNEYRRALLAGRRFNAVAELPASDLLDAEICKAIIVGDQVDARQIREKPFTLNPVAGHVFATNEPPAVQDHSLGFWRRFIPITFLRNFELAPERDPQLGDKIIQNELPGVMRMALEAAVRLLERGRYIIPTSSEIALREWKKGADQVALWAEDRAIRDADDRTPAGLVFDDFRQWAAANLHRGLNSKKFKERLEKLGFVHSHRHEGRFWGLLLKRGYDS
jgi:P4 family phage/plasmid primase-like protien